MKKTTLFLTLLCNLALLKAQIAKTGFENWPDGHEYTKSSWEDDGFTVPWVNGFNQSRAYIDDEVAHFGTKSLRVAYPAGGVGPSETGGQAPLTFEGKNEVYTSYWLYFSDNFDWGGTSEGGKLPGLGSGDNCSGGASCDGTNGFSARLMWRSGGDAVLYLYHMDKPETYGEDIPLMNEEGNQITFEKGKWYQVAERVKINTGNNYDGEVEVWVNGKQALLETGLRFVNDGSLIDNMYFSTFHGGSGDNWAPSVDCHIWYDDIIISTEKSDIFATLCPKPDLGDDMLICAYETIELTAGVSTDNFAIQWLKDYNPVSEGSEIYMANEPGAYVVEIVNVDCGYKSDTLLISAHDPLYVKHDTLCEPGEALVSVNEYSNYFWYSNLSDKEAFFEGREYYFNLDKDTTFYVAEELVTDYTLGLSQQSGDVWSTTNLDASDKRTKVTVEQALTINSVYVFIPNTENTIHLRVLDEDESTILHEFEYTNTTAGKNLIALDLDLEPGTYLFDVVGSTKAVDFQAENANFPYSIPGVMSFTCNVDYQCRNGWYGFFYDWDIEVKAIEKCRTPVYAAINPNLQRCTVTDIETPAFNTSVEVTPNPSTGLFSLNKKEHYKVFNSMGKVVLEGNGKHVDLTGKSAGMYFIQIREQTFRVQKL